MRTCAWCFHSAEKKQVFNSNSNKIQNKNSFHPYWNSVHALPTSFSLGCFGTFIFWLFGLFLCLSRAHRRTKTNMSNAQNTKCDRLQQSNSFTTCLDVVKIWILRFSYQLLKKHLTNFHLVFKRLFNFPLPKRHPVWHPYNVWRWMIYLLLYVTFFHQNIHVLFEFARWSQLEAQRS